MRHRKLLEDNNKLLKPLSYSVLDLMVEFISTHLTKNFLYDLYILCLGVIHRLLCYQKKCKIRFNYNWRDLWNALINLIKFVLNNESDLIKKWNIFFLCHNIINLFNLFITFGDTFLPSPQAYDDLYYEIIRMNIIFENLYSLGNNLAIKSNFKSNFFFFLFTLTALRYSSIEAYKAYSSKLANSLINIKAIINHFNAKIEAWSVTHQLPSLTEIQVLEIVRSNYDSLTLKLQDGLDQYENHNPEKVKDSKFYSTLMKKVIVEYKESCNQIENWEQKILLKDVLSLVS